MGCGLVTLTRYEKGALQDAVHDNLLKLLDEPGNLIKLAEQNPDVLSEEKYNKLIRYSNNRCLHREEIEAYG